MGTTRGPGAENPQIQRVELRKLDGVEIEPAVEPCDARVGLDENGQKDLSLSSACDADD